MLGKFSKKTTPLGDCAVDTGWLLAHEVGIDLVGKCCSSAVAYLPGSEVLLGGSP